jgi:hypothetical protein
MSWKLAELRWRHDVGLYESRWEKNSGVLPIERKRAIEAFEERRGRSRSRTASERDTKEHSISGGLGIPFSTASPALRLSLDVTVPQPTSPPPSFDHQVLHTSLLPLLQTSPDRSGHYQAPRSNSKTLRDHRRSVTRCQSCSALSESSSRQLSPTFDNSSRLRPEVNRQRKSKFPSAE